MATLAELGILGGTAIGAGLNTGGDGNSLINGSVGFGAGVGGAILGYAGLTAGSQDMVRGKSRPRTAKAIGGGFIGAGIGLAAGSITGSSDNSQLAGMGMGALGMGAVGAGIAGAAIPKKIGRFTNPLNKLYS